MWSPDRRVGIVLAAGVALIVVAIPALGASPAPSAEPIGPVKADNRAESAVSLTGVVHQSVDADGRQTYTMTVDGTTWTLSSGPPWFWGDNNPLAAFVGRSVTVAGTTHAGEADVDVETVDGQAIREPGKPPWAGGPWVVGETHPGWHDWMAGGKPGNGHGREGAPGQEKKASPAP